MDIMDTDIAMNIMHVVQLDTPMDIKIIHSVQY